MELGESEERECDALFGKDCVSPEDTEGDKTCPESFALKRYSPLSVEGEISSGEPLSNVLKVQRGLQ